MSAKENRLALRERADELRNQVVPPEFQPKEDLKLRPVFAAAEAELAPSDFEIGEAEAAPVVAPVPAPDVTDAALELEPEDPAPEINVVDTPGAPDIHEQDLDVAAVHEEARETEFRRAMQAQDAVADGRDFSGSVNGHIAHGPLANARQNESAEKKRKEADEKFTQAMLKKMLDDHIKWLDEQIEFWRKQERYWEEASDVIADAIARKSRGEEIEVDEDGLPRERRLREYVEAYEKKYGRRLDVNNSDDLLRLQQLARDEANYARDQREQREREREQAQEQLREVEANRMTPEARQRLGEQLTTLEGQKAVGEVAWLARDNRELNATIDQLAATSEADMELVEMRTAGQDGYAQADAEIEDDLFGDGPSTSFAKTADPQSEGIPALAPAFHVAANGESAPSMENPVQTIAAPVNVPPRTV